MSNQSGKGIDKMEFANCFSGVDIIVDDDLPAVTIRISRDVWQDIQGLKDVTAFNTSAEVKGAQ